MTTEPSLVLVVDDDRDIRESVAEILRDEGLVVVTSSNGKEALVMMLTGPRPGLVLTDLMMPVLDGWEFRRRQKADPTLADVPVILTAASGRPDEVAVRRTFDGYLPKPIGVEGLLAAVASYFRPQSGIACPEPTRATGA